MLSGIVSMSPGKWEDKKGEFKEIIESELDGVEAKVTFCCDEEGDNKTIDLKKVDGEWKVDMQKNLVVKEVKAM